MTLWLAFALMTAAAIFAVLWPLSRRGAAAGGRDIAGDHCPIGFVGLGEVVDDRAHRAHAINPLQHRRGDWIAFDEPLGREQNPFVACLVMAQADAARKPRHAVL